MKTLLISVVISVLAAGCATRATLPSAEAARQLAPTGTLRVAVLTSNPLIVSRTAGGELGGTTPALARQLARYAGTDLKVVEYAELPQLLAQAPAGLWDVAVLPVDPARSGAVDFAPPHLTEARSGARLAFAVPKNRELALVFVSRWIEEAKEMGLVQVAIDAAGLRNEAGVAPAPGH